MQTGNYGVINDVTQNSFLAAIEGRFLEKRFISSAELHSYLIYLVWGNEKVLRLMLVMEVSFRLFTFVGSTKRNAYC